MSCNHTNIKDNDSAQMISVWRYDGSADRALWDEFVRGSRNATFLFYRDYMDYHADRFTDISLIISDARQRVVALLPLSLSADGKVVTSHGGLTYGGLIIDRRMTGSLMIAVLDAVIEWLRDYGVKSLIYKAMPFIYPTLPSQEDEYALWLRGAQLLAVNLSSSIDLLNPLGFDQNNRRNVKKALSAGVVTEVSTDFPGFWGILTERLEQRYDSRPVHSLEEITLLAERFPDNIRLHVARSADGNMIAGVVTYLTDTCCHCQYIASNEEGRSLCALSLLFSSIIADATERRMRWVDFGTSNEQRGRVLNHSLLDQKCRMGGRGVAYNIYSLEIG